MAEPLTALDIKYPAGEPIQSSGIAYYRLDPQMKEFFTKCAKDHVILGFEYEEGSWNFGVILNKKLDAKQPDSKI